MKLVFVEALDSRVSSIGFGSASLGSRIGVRKGLKTLERAYEAGITWYDVAPSYGDGTAESICGEFVSRKRDSIYVCTKVGMRPTNTSAAMRVLMPLARAAITTFPALQRYVYGMRPAPFKVPLSGELITTSVEESLRRLRTDYIDVLALHRPTAEEVVREDIVRAVERVIRDGKARAVSIAGAIEAAMRGLDELLPYRLVPIANGLFMPNLEKLKERALPGRTFVTYGTFSSLNRLVARINAQEGISRALHDLGYRGNPAEVAATFVVDYAFATNSAGITLFSMLHKEHLDFNLSRLGNHLTREQLDPVVAALLEGVPRADPMPHSPLSQKKGGSHHVSRE